MVLYTIGDRRWDVSSGGGGGGAVQHVLGADDEAPASPDETGACEGEVLGEGELLGGTGEVGDTGKDERPLSRSQY